MNKKKLKEEGKQDYTIEEKRVYESKEGGGDCLGPWNTDWLCHCQRRWIIGHLRTKRRIATSGHACGGDGDWRSQSAWRRAICWIRLFANGMCEWCPLDSLGDLRGDQSRSSVEQGVSTTFWQMTSQHRVGSRNRNLGSRKLLQPPSFFEPNFRQGRERKNKPSSWPRPKHKNKTGPL